MASNDLEIIKKIEKTTGKRLRRFKRFKPSEPCYVVNEQEQVLALNLWDAGLSNADCYLVQQFVNLQTLDLSGNQISDYSFLKELDQLQWLDLSGNQISDISFPKQLVNLQTLSLSWNDISDISSLQQLVNLQSLDLSFNKICDISFLKELDQLQWLDLRSNKIIRLPQWIAEHSPEIVYSTNLDQNTINVGGNPLTHPPPEIIQQGREAIRAYFRSLEKDEAVTLHEAKVLLVGDGKAGKTSLLKRLQGLPFDEHESQTHGINVQPLLGSEIAGFANPDEDCRLHFWDFGGQEIMHASHRFFMSKRSLYILVLDSRDDTGRCHWRWLRHIEKYGDKPPCIVAMNKMDANPSYNIEQKSINSRFPAIENRFFQISCKSNDGLPELVRSMAASVPKTPLYGLVISKSWLTIRKRLETATEEQNYISREQFLAICKEHGVQDEESRMTLLKFLNDLGTVLFFEKLKLADIYVLDPHWVTVGVYKIINSAKTKDGLLREEDLEFILNQEPVRADEYDPAKKAFAYTVREQEYLVRIMEEFELCYRYDKHLHILPSQLPKEPEQEPELRGGNLLRFIMEYDFLPSSLFPRLMVRLKEDIPDRRQQWRHGMYLENKQFGVQAIVRMEEQSSRITISIYGGPHDKQRYLCVIRHHIAGLGFQELKPKELVPLPGHEDALVEYQVLLGHEQEGIAQYFDGKLRKFFSVSELLDNIVSKHERSKEGNIMIHLENIGNPQMTQTNSQQQSQHQQQSANLLKEAQGLFHNLKEDIIAEADIEFDDAKEKKRVENELTKAEKALAEAESAAAEGKEPDAAAKSRLEEFFTSLADKSSRLGKLLESVDQGAEKVRKLARTYNKVAENIGLPSVPPLLLGKEQG
uniref:COR domain-containing protein n=1 Tax=Candidatus Electronema sp. TaxID=2698783 RepID=UPI00405685BE